MKDFDSLFSKSFFLYLGFFAFQAILSEPTYAQCFNCIDEDEPIEEIVTYGIRPVSGGSYFYVTVYDSPVSNGVYSWLEQLGAVIAEVLNTISDAEVDVDAECSAQQSEFRTSCLELAHEANNYCLSAGALFTGAAASISGAGAVGVGIVGLNYCSDLNYDANNACNDAADNFTYPDAPPQCTADN